MFDDYEKSLLKDLVLDHLEGVEDGTITYGDKENNSEVIERLESILQKLE